MTLICVSINIGRQKCSPPISTPAAIFVPRNYTFDRKQAKKRASGWEQVDRFCGASHFGFDKEKKKLNLVCTRCVTSRKMSCRRQQQRRREIKPTKVAPWSLFRSLLAQVHLCVYIPCILDGWGLPREALGERSKSKSYRVFVCAGAIYTSIKVMISQVVDCCTTSFTVES